MSRLDIFFLAFRGDNVCFIYSAEGVIVRSISMHSEVARIITNASQECNLLCARKNIGSDYFYTISIDAYYIGLAKKSLRFLSKQTEPIFFSCAILYCLWSFKKKKFNAYFKNRQNRSKYYLTFYSR